MSMTKSPSVSPLIFSNTRATSFIEPAGSFHVTSRGCSTGTRVAFGLFNAAEIVCAAASFQSRAGVAFSTVKRSEDTLLHALQNPNDAS